MYEWIVYYREKDGDSFDIPWSSTKRLDVQADSLSDAREKVLVLRGHGVTGRVMFMSIEMKEFQKLKEGQSA